MTLAAVVSDRVARARHSSSPAQGRAGAPLFEPDPGARDLTAVVVDPARASDGRRVGPGWDRGPRAQVPDVLAKGVAGVAAVRQPQPPLGARRAVSSRTTLPRWTPRARRLPNLSPRSDRSLHC
jgi:hypothetical protein